MLFKEINPKPLVLMKKWALKQVQGDVLWREETPQLT